jgi:hypothetical protein
MKRRDGVALASVLLTSGCLVTVGGHNGSGGGPISVGDSVSGTLTTTDTHTPLPARSATPYYADLYTISLTAGVTVTIMECEELGSDFDPYLVIDNGAGDTAHNDDSGRGYNGHGSLLAFTPLTTGTYTIYASTFRTALPSVGDAAYTLQVAAGDQSLVFQCPH